MEQPPTSTKETATLGSSRISAGPERKTPPVIRTEQIREITQFLNVLLWKHHRV